MADFCHQCTFDMFGEEMAPFNDMVNSKLDDDEMATVLCEGCGWINVDRFGRKLHWNEDIIMWGLDQLCPHGIHWQDCRFVVHKEKKCSAYVSALNFHGVGEFIAQYPEGDASSDAISDYIPTCNSWEMIDRLLTP